MSGNARRTGKIEAARQIAALLNLRPPESRGATVPASWLRQVVDTLHGQGAADGASGKRALMRLAVVLSGGTWSDEMVVMPGSTVTGEALWSLHDLIASRSEHGAAPPAGPSTGLPEGLTVPIRPKVGMYSAFARLNYRPWYAIAEFVDNALQSFLTNRDRLTTYGAGVLRVQVRLDGDILRIADNAGGIAVADMDRAFAPALPPPDRTGLSEFGIGMKAAACWFSNHWVVRTSALGEPVEREVVFDVPDIVARGTEYLEVRERPARADEHYTVIQLSDLRVQPRGRTIAKIREHLASIYRIFLRRGDLELHFVTPSISDLLQHQEPSLLTAPYFREPESEPRTWRKELEMDVGEGQRVWGWAGLLATASTTRAGFAVLRRDRLIEGSVDDTWRPERIFRTPNTYTYQRLVGEIQVEGFDVSHTKDGVQWGEVEETVLDLLYELIDDDEMPLIRQAEGHRVRKKAKKVKRDFGQQAVDATGNALAARAQPVIRGQLENPTEEPERPAPLRDPEAVTAERVIEIRPRDDNRIWLIRIQVVRERAEDWYSYLSPQRTDATSDGCEVWELEIRLNLDHPFSEQFVNEDEAVLTPIVRIVAALALAETTALEVGTRYAGRVRRNFNDLLRQALSTAEVEDSDEQ